MSSASDGKHGALPLTLHQLGYDGARVEYVNSANQNATKYATDANQANRETGDRMASISIQQGRESAGAAYAAAGTSIAGHKTAQSLSDQASRVEFTGRITGAEITQKAAIDSAKLQAISTIISRMGAKLAQDIEKGMEDAVLTMANDLIWVPYEYFIVSSVQYGPASYCYEGAFVYHRCALASSPAPQRFRSSLWTASNLKLGLYSICIRSRQAIAMKTSSECFCQHR